MSSDNGIYLLISPVEDFYGKKIGEEARVIEAQAIENIQYDDGTLTDDDFNPKELVKYFYDAKVESVDAAHKRAFAMERKIMDDDFCPVLEYGINTILTKHPFLFYVNMAAVQANKDNNQPALNDA